MKVICTIPTATSPINGHKFHPHPDRAGCLVSEDMPEEDARNLASIPGYELVGEKKPDPVGGATTTPPAGGAGQQQAPAGGAPRDADGDGTSDELEDLRRRGIGLGIPHAEQKGLKRLREEVPAAEKAAAAKATEGQQGGSGNDTQSGSGQ